MPTAVGLRFISTVMALDSMTGAYEPYDESSQYMKPKLVKKIEAAQIGLDFLQFIDSWSQWL